MEPRPLPRRTFVKNTGDPIVSYSYSDVANGLGFINFWVYRAETTGDADYNGLTATAWESCIDGAEVTQYTWTLAYSPTDPFPRTQIHDFDTSDFNVPRTVRGDLHITGRYTWDIGVANRTATLKFDLIKYDGTTETTIATYTTHTLTDSVANQDYHFIAPCAQTTIAPGDILRLRITWTLNGTDNQAGINSAITIGVSTADADWYCLSRVPFKIEN